MKQDESPTLMLSTVVVDKLIASGLMRAERREALITKIAAGTMSGNDWKLEIELASAKAVTS